MFKLTPDQHIQFHSLALTHASGQFRGGMLPREEAYFYVSLKRLARETGIDEGLLLTGVKAESLEIVRDLKNA